MNNYGCFRLFNDKIRKVGRQTPKGGGVERFWNLTAVLRSILLRIRDNWLIRSSIAGFGGIEGEEKI